MDPRMALAFGVVASVVDSTELSQSAQGFFSQGAAAESPLSIAVCVGMVVAWVSGCFDSHPV